MSVLTSLLLLALFVCFLNSDPLLPMLPVRCRLKYWRRWAATVRPALPICRSCIWVFMFCICIGVLYLCFCVLYLCLCFRVLYFYLCLQVSPSSLLCPNNGPVFVFWTLLPNFVFACDIIQYMICGAPDDRWLSREVQVI